MTQHPYPGSHRRYPLWPVLAACTALAWLLTGLSTPGSASAATPQGPCAAPAYPEPPKVAGPPGPFRETRTLSFGGVQVEAIIDRPANDAADALLLFHGTVGNDRAILSAARETLERFSALLDRQDLLLVSVAYPEEGLLMGDNVAHAEAALLWVRHEAREALGVSIGRIFLAGHSQGGYIATRLGTLHAVDGIVANAPGPLDLRYRCALEEEGRLKRSVACGNLAAAFGSTRENPEAYEARSLLAYTDGHRADLLFVQGLDDAPVHLRSWPIFRARMEACTDCRSRRFLELPGQQHAALFGSPEARAAFQAFLRPPSTQLPAR